MPLIEARGLNVQIPTEDGTVHAVQDVSFSVEKGEFFGIVGESGSGKSVLTQAIVGLLPGAQTTGDVTFDGIDLLSVTPAEMRGLRGTRIAMIFQDPLSSLHPYYRIGDQIAEMIQLHEKVSRKDARTRVIDMLERVGIPDAASRYDSYPHEFSGGMRQRVMIAMALVLDPDLIIADEPTTALDVTVQQQILQLLDDMRRELGTTVIMISHDLTLLGAHADRAMVMYAGHRLEIGPMGSLFGRPAHPYTQGLLRSSPQAVDASSRLQPIEGTPPSLLVRPKGCTFAPRCSLVREQCLHSQPPLKVYDDGTEAACVVTASGTPDDTGSGHSAPADTVTPTSDDDREPVVSVNDVRLSFGRKNHQREVLKGISLSIAPGSTIGLVGESGCGKTTLAKVIAGLVPPNSGSVRVAGHTFGDGAGTRIDRATWKAMRKDVQIVFQDPFGSLNPRRRVGAIIGDPFRIHGTAHGAERKEKVRELMKVVGLNPEHYNRFPSEFSGGQRQRIGIARALALSPSVIILDEPVSALDVSIQAQVLNLLSDLQEKFELTYLFISHDLAVVRHICDTIAVMDGGQIVEFAPAEELYTDPQHPFTRRLLAASVHEPPAPPTAERVLINTQEVQHHDHVIV